MDEDLRDVHYAAGLVDGLLLAKKTIGIDGIERAQLDEMALSILNAKAEQVFDMYIGPSVELSNKLLHFESMRDKRIA